MILDDLKAENPRQRKRRVRLVSQGSTSANLEVPELIHAIHAQGALTIDRRQVKIDQLAISDEGLGTFDGGLTAGLTDRIAEINAISWKPGPRIQLPAVVSKARRPSLSMSPRRIRRWRLWPMAVVRPVLRTVSQRCCRCWWYRMRSPRRWSVPMLISQLACRRLSLHQLQLRST